MGGKREARLLGERSAIVTGAASGIGLASATALAGAGCRVTLADIVDTGAAAASLCRQGATAWAAHADVSRAPEVERLVEEAVGRAGGLDILVAAAGIGGGAAPTAEYSERDFLRVLEVNLCGVFHAMKYSIRAMLAGGRGGAIVNIASIMGVVGLAQTPAYSAAKGGVIQLTKVAALEYARHGIRVNCIAPGMIDTPMARQAPAEARRAFVTLQPLGRLGTAEEVADAVLYLAGDAASFTTGVVLPVDGGFLAQ